MSILVDTNLLLRSLQPTHAHFVPATKAIGTFRESDRLCIAPQNLYELWAVCTRPAPQNGLGMTTGETRAELARLRSVFHLLADVPAIYFEWERLVTQYDAKGKTAHDTRLVAAMNVHGVKRLLTFNVSDFKRYADIDVIDPSSTP